MNLELAAKVADAVLYEGYILYPYRPSAIKNRQRWTFGILYPPGYEEVVRGTERAAMHSECLLLAKGDASVRVRLRFLHSLARQVMADTGEGLVPVPSLEVDGQLVESWDEASERTVELEMRVANNATARQAYRFPASDNREPLRDASGKSVGQVRRTQEEVSGSLTVRCEEIGDRTFKLSIDVENECSSRYDAQSRNAALLSSMLSAHCILTISEGEFVSLLDPPEGLREAVKGCKNVGNFPVLIGDEGERDMLLCSPILLYDYPQVAPESAGDFFDATEIDEMLTLRVMTLTDEEKNEMRLADERARALLERTEDTVYEQLRKTHGAIRSLRPVNDDE